MSNEPRHDRHLESLLDELDRSSLRATDAEVLEDARTAGVDPAANAQGLKTRFLSASRRYQKRKFEAAKLAHAKQAEALSKRSYKSPHRRRNSASYFNWWSLNRPERVSLSRQSSGTSTAFLTATSPALLKNSKHLVCSPS